MCFLGWTPRKCLLLLEGKTDMGCTGAMSRVESRLRMRACSSPHLMDWNSSCGSLGSGSGRAEIVPSHSCPCLAKPVCSHRPELRPALSQVARSTQTLLPLWVLLMATSTPCPGQGTLAFGELPCGELRFSSLVLSPLWFGRNINQLKNEAVLRTQLLRLGWLMGVYCVPE